jgi:hypothetical protein
MKKALLLLAVAVTLVAGPSSAAVPRNNDVGLGIVLGNPSGVLGQFFMTRKALLDVTLAWSLNSDAALMAAVDYQIYNNIADAPAEWSWYYGGGGYVAFPENEDGILGVRVPLGIAYSFPRSIVDLWVEIDPGLQLIPDTEAEIMGGVGVTFWIR